MDRFVLTPWFLEEPQPQLEASAEADWWINRCPPTKPEAQVAAVHGGLADLVTQAVAAGDRPVSVAGDCCSTIAVAAGLQRAGVAPTLVWLDAHGDFNTPETSPSGFLGGMPLAMLVGRGDQRWLQGVGLTPLAEDRVILGDARDLDEGERRLVEGSSIKHVRDVRALGASVVGAGPLWIHLDVDIADPIDVAAVPYPAPGGKRAAELEAIFRDLAAAAEIAAVSVATWSPKLDPDGRSRDASMAMLRALLR